MGAATHLKHVVPVVVFFYFPELLFHGGQCGAGYLLKLMTWAMSVAVAVAATAAVAAE